ncbi:protein kinase domain protein [Gregarina niphandrodes]|uniref:Protein kinase domain protein n=1 Tax=Gregarina niphandrodes TaxID=110365 RepID=A0A023B1W2_GRENI|nr:protein kinase domain protein [Gregarina niphandrodes]EZG50026.1 protein kinase domain protein [Gregarina niphandrodes]|eukprot:XP_011132030.1 protein kinase domain protein [Gregarina niphandrodes]
MGPSKLELRHDGWRTSVILHKRYMTQTLYYTNANKEFRILEKLKGSNHVVDLRASIETSAGDRLLILEYLPHRLFTFMEDGIYDCTLTELGIWEVARQILNGLDELRRKNVCHKDIKPENILTSQKLPEEWVMNNCENSESIGPQMFKATELGHSNILIDDLVQKDNIQPPSDLLTIVLIDPTDLTELKNDFKIKFVDFNISSESLNIYDAEGTNAFTPPEVFLKTANTFDGVKRDLWSIGCSLFISAFGRLPFWHRVPIHLQLSIINEPIHWEHYRNCRPDLSNDVVEFIKSLLEKNPARRMSLDEALGIATKHVPL